MTAQKKLNVVMTVDPANSTEKQSDYSACIIQGQTPDGRDRYILDGFRDKIAVKDLARVIADYIEKWQDICTEARTSFRFGIESFSFQQFIAPQIRDEMRKRGRNIFIHELKPKKRAKIDRIKVLITPFMAGRYYLPIKLRKNLESKQGPGYDLIRVLLEEYSRFPT